MHGQAAGLNPRRVDMAKSTWTLWYQDTFDRDCPRQIESQGQKLEDGLTDLWRRHLNETVQADGTFGFARFNLWWHDQSINIVGPIRGALRLKAWTTSPARLGRPNRLLRRIAQAHARLIRQGQDSEAILAAAARATDRAAFQAWIRKANHPTIGEQP